MQGVLWALVRETNGWGLFVGEAPAPVARVTMQAETAWKAFFRAAPERQLVEGLRVSGDERLGLLFLEVAAVMR